MLLSASSSSTLYSFFTTLASEAPPLAVIISSYSRVCARVSVHQTPSDAARCIRLCRCLGVKNPIRVSGTVDRYLTGCRATRCVCGSALTPLRGGLERDSMETLSERVSVRNRERVWRRELERRRGKEEQMEKKSKEVEKRERCVTPDDDAAFCRGDKGKGVKIGSWKGAGI